MRMSLETSRPPPSRVMFQVRPQSSRSRMPWAVKMARWSALGAGDVAEVFGLQGDRPGDAADGQVPGQMPAGALPAEGAAGEGSGGVAGSVGEVRRRR
jgi:hypothetical protein